nr:aldehyde dehydrogenase family protein [Paraburkholderia caballeronis]
MSKVMFTGPVPTGIDVGVAAMQAGLKPVTLELGGKHRPGFLRDFPVERTVDGIMEAACLHQREVCASADDVLEALARKLATLKIGSALDESAQFGPLANAAHFGKVMAFFDDARRQHGEIVYGGAAADDAGFFVQPTAILARSQNDAIMTRKPSDRSRVFSRTTTRKNCCAT